MSALQCKSHIRRVIARTTTCLPAVCLGFSCVLRPCPAHAAQKARDTYTITTPAPADYSNFQWLIGDWSGKTTGKGAQGDVLLSASFALGKRFIILREQLSLPATKLAPASTQESIGILSGGSSGSKYQFAQYSSNGFVTRYQVSVGNGEIDFNPAGGLEPPSGWLFRRSIRQTNKDECVETIDVAPPNQPFFNYYTASLRHTTPKLTGKQASTVPPAKRRGIFFWLRGVKSAAK
jgi:hypothetical protein